MLDRIGAYQGSRASVIAAHLTQPVPQPSSLRPAIPVAFDRVIARGMAKNPEDRFDTAGAFALAANDALATTDQDKAADILRRSQAATMPPAWSTLLPQAPDLAPRVRPFPWVVAGPANPRHRNGPYCPRRRCGVNAQSLDLGQRRHPCGGGDRWRPRRLARHAAHDHDLRRRIQNHNSDPHPDADQHNGYSQRRRFALDGADAFRL